MTNDSYKPDESEAKWQKKWLENKIGFAKTDPKLKKSYIMIEFPYPSGDKLHVGHARSYTCLDSVARKRRMQGKNVLFPFGWDAFGLPAENYAIKTGIHPTITTKTNIEHAREQAKSWGLSFDWAREVNTTDPEYYKWTQWIFIQLFKKGLAYKEEIAVNWCPDCKINLANEEVIDGNCERCGAKTERRKQSQWMLRITAYADRLLEDLKTVNFREDIAAQQINWIGKKEGAKVQFEVMPSLSTKLKAGIPQKLEAFTTRLDTLFGVTFVVVAPEVAEKWLDEVIPEDIKAAVGEYVTTALNKSERERKLKEGKTGVDTGLKVKNPANGEEVPIWVADYVMMDVGTGVVMGVPAHDERDEQFARKYKLPIVQVVDEEGKLVNSGKYSGLSVKKAVEGMIEDRLGELANHYHLRDWVFSRQHYWGEPIPMIFCAACAKNHKSQIQNPNNQININSQNTNSGWFPVAEEELPIKLPKVEKYQPTGTGESPLAHIESFVDTICPECGGPAKRETDTMPNWAGSSWYFLRYCDPDNKNKLADYEKLKYWLPVDWYNGGMEHTTLHLLYSRFWHKFLYDLGVVPTPEPYAKRTSHGVILGPDGKKMSKSKGNVINPDEVVRKYGADTLRLYEMFIGPFDQSLAWSWESLEGVNRFLKRVWNLAMEKPVAELGSEEAKRMVAKLVMKVDYDLENMKFNTAVAAMMGFGNWWSEHRQEMGKDEVRSFLLALAPCAPFLAEELYQRLYSESDDFESIHCQSWPAIAKQNLQEETMKVVAQVDGKVRGVLEMRSEDAVIEAKVKEKVLEIPKVQEQIGKKGYRVVFVPGKIFNIVRE